MIESGFSYDPAAQENRPIRREEKKLIFISPIYNDTGFHENSDTQAKRKFRVNPINEPIVLCIEESLPLKAVEERITRNAPTGSDAACFGCGRVETDVGGYTKYLPVQYYQIRKPFWQKVDDVLRTFWRFAETDGELR